MIIAIILSSVFMYALIGYIVYKLGEHHLSKSEWWGYPEFGSVDWQFISAIWPICLPAVGLWKVIKITGDAIVDILAGEKDD